MTRIALLIAGVIVAIGAWTVPQSIGALEPFSQHMVRHMALIAVAAPLLAAGSHDAVRGVHVSPLAATVFEFLVVWGWHLPAMHEWSAVSTAALVAEQASFLLAGLLLWRSVFEFGRGLAGAGGMMLTSMHMTFLGALLILSPRILYGAICFGVDPLSDQRLGGMLMLALGTPVYLLAGLILVGRELKLEDETGQGAS